LRGWSLSASLPTALLERTNPAWPGALSAAVHQPNNPNPARGRTRRRATTCGASRRSVCSTKSRSSKISPSRSARRATLHVPESLYTHPSHFTRVASRLALHAPAAAHRRSSRRIGTAPAVDRQNEPPARRRSCHSSCTTTSSSAARSSRRATTRHARRSAPCSSRSVQRYNPTSRLKIDIEKH
jgi:hypothetical protein